MYFSRPTVVARAKRNLLELYLPPKNQYYKIDIPQNILNYLDVVNEDYFVKFLEDFLVKLPKIPANVNLVLESDIVFEKTIVKTSEPIDKNAIDSFLACVPVDKNKLAKKTYLLNNQYFVYATNNAYYKSLIKAFTGVAWRVNYVVPLSIFGINSQDQTLSNQNLELITKGKKLAQKVNFLEQDQPK